MLNQLSPVALEAVIMRTNFSVYPGKDGIFILQWPHEEQHLRWWCIRMWRPTAPQSASWWHHEMEMLSKFMAFCEWNPPVTGGFSSQKASNARLKWYLLPVWSCRKTVELPIISDPWCSFDISMLGICSKCDKSNLTFCSLPFQLTWN